MTQIIAWECPDTGKIFKNESEFKSHRHKVNGEKRRNKNIEKIRIDIREGLRKCASTEEIENFILLNAKLFSKNAHTRFHMLNKRKPNSDIITHVSIDIDYRDMKTVSNTHCSPHGKPQNFMCEPHLHKGYTGWKGRINYSISNVSSFASDVFSNTAINTGTGGGGSANVSYELTLFADDFPMLLKAYEEYKVYDVLCNESI